MPSSYTLIDILRSISMTKDALKTSIGTDNENVTDYSYLIHNQKIDVYNNAQERGYQYVWESIRGISGSPSPTPIGGKVDVPGVQYAWDETYDGLIDIMEVVLNSRLAMKSELEINTDIFEDYPYYISYQLDNTEDEGYHNGILCAYNQPIDVPEPIIGVNASNEVIITSQVANPSLGYIEYWIDNSTNKETYSNPFTPTTSTDSCIVHARQVVTIEGVTFISDVVDYTWNYIPIPYIDVYNNNAFVYIPDEYYDGVYRSLKIYYSFDNTNWNLLYEGSNFGYSFYPDSNAVLIPFTQDTYIYVYYIMDDVRSSTVNKYCQYFNSLAPDSENVDPYTPFTIQSHRDNNRITIYPAYKTNQEPPTIVQLKYSFDNSSWTQVNNVADTWSVVLNKNDKLYLKSVYVTGAISLSSTRTNAIKIYTTEDYTIYGRINSFSIRADWDTHPEIGNYDYIVNDLSPTFQGTINNRMEYNSARHAHTNSTKKLYSNNVVSGMFNNCNNLDTNNVVYLNNI